MTAGMPFQKRSKAVSRRDIVLIVALASILFASTIAFTRMTTPIDEYVPPPAAPQIPSQETPQQPPVSAPPSNKDATIQIYYPQENDAVSSPLLVSGVARGTWFFEATFPLEIRDDTGKVLGTGYVESLSDWMTEDFVPFQGTLKFTKPTTDKGVLIIQNSNPSGLICGKSASRYGFLPKERPRALASDTFCLARC